MHLNVYNFKTPVNYIAALQFKDLCVLLPKDLQSQCAFQNSQLSYFFFL